MYKGKKNALANNFSLFTFHVSLICCTFAAQSGGLAQLARALAWHARGHRFEPDILHDGQERFSGKRGASFLLSGASPKRHVSKLQSSH